MGSWSSRVRTRVMQPQLGGVVIGAGGRGLSRVRTAVGSHGKGRGGAASRMRTTMASPRQRCSK
eukprot:353511-Chlamydomonas_euryale.AAC.8